MQHEKFIKLYSGQFEVFNPIQTQVFNSVYKNDNNVLITAPTGSGKTVCAELAIFRMLSQLASGKKISGRCVYIAPLEALAKERYADWSKKFGKLGINVVMLTGGQDDLRTLKAGQIVISTPKAWDIMSRRWKTRRDVQTVSLFIVDEIHLIGGDIGPVLEVVVSRMRYIAAQTENKIRIVALGTSVANAKDLGDWIGATSSYLYNFHPNVRPVPLEIRVQGFHINHFPSRMLAMSKPTFLAVKRLSAGKPVIVFVPSRKQAARAAVELMTYAAAEEDPKRYLHADEGDIKEYLDQIDTATLKETLACGVGFLHTGLKEKEKKVVEELYNADAIQIVVVEHSLCWGLTLAAHLVVIMGTQHYDGSEHRYVDYPITSVVQMMGRACRPLKDSNGKCSIFCYAPKKEFYKKFLYEPFPVESHLDHMLHNHLNAEIGTKTIENFQDAVDYLTWTFMYRRLTQNPNYYNLQGTSHRHVSDHLSELIEGTLQDLETSKCISIDDIDLSPLNLGMIASYYYITYTTVELFNSSLGKKTKMKGLMEILSHANEFETVPLRQGEERALERLARRMPWRVNAEDGYHSPHVKAHLLLQSHFSRQKLSPTVQADRDALLPIAVRLLQAIVDVISSGGWLEPALAAMELSQMIVQGMWSNESVLLQIPHMTKEVASKAAKAGIKSIFDVLDMEDEDREKLLSMSEGQMNDVATMCNAYPNVDVKFEIADADEITAGGRVVMQVALERDADDEDEDEDGDTKDAGFVVEPVYSKRYPVTKSEAWWLVIGDPKKNKLISIKRVVMRKKVHNIRLDFIAPAEGDYNLKLFFMCDSYLGCDQEYEFKIKVLEGEEDDDDDDDDDEDDED
uniref:Helicase ATP-binding domain-containing protein n=1 Tax=Lotharella oceanica TaxID=641309 RepID=A0A7S2XFJ4_9EUKA